MNTVVEINFSAGHKLVGLDYTGSNLHGHNYKAIFYARRVEDIGCLPVSTIAQDFLNGWIEAFWNHNCIVSKEDEKIVRMLKTISRTKEPFVLDKNPTAENMASYLLKKVCPLVFEGFGISVEKVILKVTDSISAEATL